MVTSKIVRYGLYWAQLDPTRGSEISKTRPVVVVSPDDMNRSLETVVVCPLTSQLHPHWASRVACACDGVESEIASDVEREVRALLGQEDLFARPAKAEQPHSTSNAEQPCSGKQQYPIFYPISSYYEC